LPQNGGERSVLLKSNVVVREKSVMSPAEARLKEIQSEIEVPSEMSDAEWNQRVNLAAAYRLVAFYGWDDLVDTFPPGYRGRSITS
jgi:hypothetical protein